MARKPAGKVYLAGAGPGDPELLTLKALRLIETADVVVYDRLVSPEILNLIPDNVARVDVGKRPGSHPVPQESINRILIKLAKSGQNVVRLKGGDPMIFGRGGEEVDMLERHDIAVETIPGITAAQGCAASLNLPLTHRGVARSLVYMTGHTKDDQVPDMDWSELVKTQSTLVVYMGAAKIAKITGALIAAGLDGQTPALAVCSATTKNQREVMSTVSNLSHDALAARFDGPVLFMLGKAVGLAASQREMTDAHKEKQLAVVGN